MAGCPNTRHKIVVYNIGENEFTSFDCSQVNRGVIQKIVEIWGQVGLMVVDFLVDAQYTISLWIANRDEDVFVWRVYHVFPTMPEVLFFYGFHSGVLTSVSFFDDVEDNDEENIFRMRVSHYRNDNSQNIKELNSQYTHPYTVFFTVKVCMTFR